MHFFERLSERVRAVDSMLCVGLDPHAAELPEPTAAAALAHGLRLIQATTPYAACFKPNAAFFEALGPPGVAALAELIAAVPPEVPVLLDNKRGDIASTAEAYAQAAFGAFGAGALTVNPYLGVDSLRPFLEHPTGGAFVVCRSSNPGAADLQERWVLGEGGLRRVYAEVARQLRPWGGRVGLVVGATAPEALAEVRALAPEAWILAPGVGVQGGALEATVQAGLRADGLGLLVNASRQIARAAGPAQAARTLRDQLRLAALSPRVQAEDALREALARGLVESGCVKFGEFTLKSGLSSPIYIDLRLLVDRPALLLQAAAAYLPLLAGLRVDRLAALPYAALPIGTGVSLLSGAPLIYPRREAKSYGTRVEIEGRWERGDWAVVLDDLATTGGSKFEAIQRLEAAGLTVRDVVVLIDRQSGAGDALMRAGYRMHAVFTLTELLDIWERQRQVPAERIQATRLWLDSPAASG